MRATFPSLCLALGLALFSAALLPMAAEAGGGLKATLALSLKDPPTSMPESSLMRFAQAHRPEQRKLTDGSFDNNRAAVKYEDRVFLAWLVTKFNNPPNDHEFQIVFYDVTNGAREFIDSTSIFINKSEGQKTFVTPLKLKRNRFKPNRKMELVVTVLRQEVGSLKFETHGKEKEHSGVVSFGPDGK
jgi:hypothetical protein